MDDAHIKQVLANWFDQVLLFHGFTDYMRDYELVVSGVGEYADQAYSLLFKNCVYMKAESALSTGVWARSLDDRLISGDVEELPRSYVWGVRSQQLYPGFALIEDSSVAKRWTHEMGFPLRQVIVETNGHTLDLVFSDLVVSPVEPGYSPFRLT